MTRDSSGSSVRAGAALLRRKRRRSLLVRLTLLRLAVAVAFVASACTGGDDTGPEASTTSVASRPLPVPVEVLQEPEGVALADPAFTPLPGAKADFGRLGGSVYQVEMPDDWNGRLVLWMHGWEEFGPEASVSAPDIRASLIRRGFAWGASSFSSTSWIPGRSTDETAALWDYVTKTYDRPSHTYVIGLSMGGAAGHIAAERYGDRFDGVLALCGSAGATPGLLDGANMFVAAAYVAGVTQAEFDATQDVGALIDGRIRPALGDEARREQFERLVVDLSGGPRPFDREGFRLEEETAWRRAALAVTAGVVTPREEPYDLGPLSDISDEAFNRAAIRLRTDDDALRGWVAGNEITGDLQVPLLTLHSTGDGQVPIDQARIVRRRVDNAGKGDLLVQRVIRDPGHCGFTTTEWAAGFDALVEWVEHDEHPEGNDVLSDDLGALDPTFELLPRVGTPEEGDVPGADDRVVVRGNVTLDGVPYDPSFLGAHVQHDGLVAPCGLSFAPGIDFEIEVPADSETTGCGTAGARVLFWINTVEGQLFSADTLPWPGDGTTTEFAVSFSTAAPQGAAPVAVASFVGEVLGADGRYVPPGTRIEALVGDTLCGVTSTRRSGSFSGYSLTVVGPDDVPGCEPGATLTFRAGGEPAEQTAPNVEGRQSMDLTL